MQKQSTLVRPCLIAGMFALSMLIGISGCGTKANTTTNVTSSAPQGKDSATTQPNQGQNTNPAVKAAMDIILLQKNTQVVLTSDQKNKIKPILTELINSTDTTQDYLQKKADAITAEFTDTQKSFLNTKSSKPQKESSTTGTPPTGTPPNEQSSTNNQNGNQNRLSSQPMDIYTQALNSLT